MLQVSELTRRYGSFVAVNGASFEIEKGEIVGLLGHNGAGKTTIMKMISGYLEPDRGRVWINGIDLATAAENAQRDLGYLPENLPVYPEMSVADYLDYAAQLKGLAGEEKRSEIARAVRATDIGEKLLDPIYTLSRGFKQRVGVAQAILGKPKLLILDEPTNGLDPTQTEHMRQLIRDIAQDATVILSTHIMQEVEALCDRVLILNRGELAVDAKLDDIRKSNRVRVETSLDAEALQRALSGIPHTDIRFDGAFATLTLAEDQEAKTLCSRIASSVISAGGDLYQLVNEKRDLESLFKEASKGISEGGLSDAA